MPIISPKIPSGLEELMRGLAKSVIKENPQNIYEFAAEYFENLLKERDGSCDQSYKKFATYKVYKKNKNARLRRDKENSNDVNDIRPDNGFKKDVSFKKDSSVEELILPVAVKPLQAVLAKTSISSESEVNDLVKQKDEEEASVLPVGNSEEDDDIKNMVLDDDMEKAALKIQSSFRGHKVRRGMKETKLDEEDNITGQVEGEENEKASELEGESKEQVESELDDNESREIVEGLADQNQSGENVECEQDIAVDDTEAPLQSEVDDDIANMVLDDDMEQAALKIQASFRGHKVRRGMKETDGPENSGNLVEESVTIADEKLEEKEEIIEGSGDLKVAETENVEAENVEVVRVSLDKETVEAERLSIEKSVEGDEIVQDVVVNETENVEHSNELVEVNEEVVVKETSRDSLVEAEGEQVVSCEAEAENVENEATAIDGEKLVEETGENIVEDELVSVVEQEVESVLEEAVERVDGQEAKGIDSIERQEIVSKPEVENDKENSLEKTTSLKSVDRDNEIVKVSKSVDKDDDVVKSTESFEKDTKVVEQTESFSENVETVERTESSKSVDREGIEEIVDEQTNDVDESVGTENEKLKASTEISTAEGEVQNDEDKEDETTVAEGEKFLSEGLNEPLGESTSVENAIDKVTEEVEDVPVELENVKENFDENSVTADEEQTEKLETDERENNEHEEISDEVVSETQQKAEGIDQDLLEGEGLSPQKGASIENDDAEKLEEEPSVVDEAAENSENLVECENVIESNDNVKSFEASEAAEKESLEEKPQETIEVVEENAELNELEPQEGLTELPNENENLDTIEDSEFADAIPVVEEICEKKFIEQLEPDREIVENEIDEKVLGRDSLNQIEGDQENLVESRVDVNDNLEKLPSGEIEYSTLKESISEHDDGEPAGSIDEADNKSRELTDEKSIDGDSNASRLQSFDDIQDDAIEQAESKQNESVARSSTVDKIEMNETQQAELDLHLNEPTATETVESILNADVSPIELMDEVVNECAGVVANELFGGEVEHLDQESNLEISEEKAIEEKQLSEHVQPTVSVENPLEGIEQPKSIDLTQETVQLSNEEIAPIIDEILQPETEESEIPEESQAPVDENIPTVSMEEKSPTVDKDEPLPDDETEGNTDPQPKAEDDDVADMILDEEMEDAALKIQAVFRGHKVRKEKIVEPNEKPDENVDDKSESVKTNVVIDQCSEQTEDTQEQDETEQQDTSADVEEIQESEAVEEDETNEERQDEEENVEEETAVENETAEEAEDDPEAAPEGETSEQQTNNDDDDVANMVLDDEMENAALKIQATFRGHKTRKDIKKDEAETSTAEEPQEAKDPVQEVDDDIANMVLDEDMENAALLIQASFRGKAKKEIKKKDDEKKEEDEAEEKKEEEPETPKEETPASSSTEKTAKQLQDEEDIAGIVMDAEMEQTAKKIQSVFRRKKGPKDSNESTSSSGGDQTDEGEEEDDDDDEENKDPFMQTESQEHEETADRNYDDEKGSEHSTAHYSSLDDGKYSLERLDERYDDKPMVLNSTIEDLNLMQGGGIFPETSGESSDMLTGSSGEGRDPDRNSSNEKVPSTESQESDEMISQETAVEPLDDEQVIEKFDFVANKDTAEAMYYSLKKNEIETQKRLSSEKQLSEERQPETDDELAMSMETMTNLENQSLDEDDDDVVIGQRQSSAKRLKYGMSMDDRLLGSILSQDYSKKVRKEGDYPDDGFDPLLEATMRSQNFMEKMHGRSTSDDDKSPAYDDYPGDDEDQFDNFYDSKSIREKIMASSFSIGDSDYFDPTHNKSIIDDDTIRTALETIHSTDSESTIASAATRIHAGERAIGKRNNNITTHSMQYSSIGNAAIDRSLDDFIQSQELRIDRFDEELEGYSSPPPRKQESVDEWTDDTTTFTDSDKKVAGAGGVIEIKLEQKTSFLTVDERRRTLHREDAIQRNSTREDEDSSKSSNVSGEKVLEKEKAPVETAVASITAQDSVIDTEIVVPVLDLTTKPKTTSSQAAKAKPLRMKRQHTMPVQIQTDVIRVIPKHLRKRIKSADNDKKKRGSK